MGQNVDNVRASHPRFATPQAVLEDRELTRQQKWRILRDWEVDALSLEVAADEGMPATGMSGLEDVRRALQHLRQSGANGVCA